MEQNKDWGAYLRSSEPPTGQGGAPQRCDFLSLGRASISALQGQDFSEMHRRRKIKLFNFDRTERDEPIYIPTKLRCFSIYETFERKNVHIVYPWHICSYFTKKVLGIYLDKDSQISRRYS